MFRYHALYCLKTSRLLHVGLVLLTVAFVLCIGNWMDARRASKYTWTAVDMPLPLERAIPVDATFTANIPAPDEFHIGIVGDAELPNEQDTKAMEQFQHLKWSVTCEGKPLETSDETWNQWNSNLSTGLGMFRVVPGRRYTVHVEGISVPARLNTAWLRLRVEVSTLQRQTRMIQTALFYMLACIVGAAGSVCLGIAVRRMMASYREMSKPNAL